MDTCLPVPARPGSAPGYPAIPGWRRASLLAGSVGIGVFAAFNNFTLSSWLYGMTTSFFLISIFGNSKSLEGAVLSPWFGALSDRTWLGWLGRRRPFILAGGALSGVLLGLTPQLARSLEPIVGSMAAPDVARIVPSLLLIFLFTLTFNLMDDQYRTLLPDLFAEQDRNRMSSRMVVAELVAQLAILLLFAYYLQDSTVVPEWTFGIAGFVVFAASVVVVLAVQEPPPAVWALGHPSQLAAGSRKSPWQTIAGYPAAVILLAATFAYWAGVNAVMPLVTVYVENVLGADKGEAQFLPALLILSTLLLAAPAATLGNRYGKRRVIGAGCAIMAIAALGGTMVSTKEQGAVLFLFAGVGNAGVIVLSLPLLAELVPKNHIGAAVGLMSSASSLAAPLSSLAVGSLSQTFGVRSIFWIMFAMVSVALGLLCFVRESSVVSGSGPAEVPPVERTVAPVGQVSRSSGASDVPGP